MPTLSSRLLCLCLHLPGGRDRLRDRLREALPPAEASEGRHSLSEASEGGESPQESPSRFLTARRSRREASRQLGDIHFGDRFSASGQMRKEREQQSSAAAETEISEVHDPHLKPHPPLSPYLALYGPLSPSIYFSEVNESQELRTIATPAHLSPTSPLGARPASGALHA